ncbi:Uncharacterised protein [Bordetella pertussis]|nr:Uncharacterised protein [Bordetella pertussis]CPN01509.1 Uncharacterised protein [Bordetella pertussis]
MGSQHPDARHPCGHGGAASRQHQRRARLLACHGQRQGQGRGQRHQGARQRQLGRPHAVGQRRRLRGAGGHLAAGQQDTQRNGQIEARRGLGQVGGRQVDGDAAGREIEAAVLDGRPHPFAAFADLDVGQPDDGKSGQAAAQMGLDAHGGRLPAGDCPAGQYGQGHGQLPCDDDAPVWPRRRWRGGAPCRKRHAAGAAAGLPMLAACRLRARPGGLPAAAPAPTIDRPAYAPGQAGPPAPRILRG